MGQTIDKTEKQPADDDTPPVQPRQPQIQIDD